MALLPLAISNTDVVTTVSLANSAPTVGPVSCTNPVNLEEGGEVTVTCTATINDTNGWEDVNSSSGKFYLKTSGYDCGADYANCYSNATCVLSEGSGTTIDAECKFTVQWYAQATSDEGNWSANITALDQVDAAGWNDTDIMVNDLLALDVVDTIDFGTLGIGAESADIPTRVNNTGNVETNLNVNGTDMACSLLGSIAVEQLAYDNATSISWSGAPKLTHTPGDTDAVFATYFRLSEGPLATANKNAYWKLKVPTGVSGECQGDALFTAVKRV